MVARRVSTYVQLLGVVLAMFWLLPAFAQSGSVRIVDPDGLFGDGAVVEAAARRLADEGAEVVVLGARNAGADPEDAQRYLDQQLAELDIAPSSSALRGNQIVFFVAPQPGFSGIYYVSRYNEKLSRRNEQSQPVYEQIMQQQMQPQFTRGALATGMAAGIDAVRTTLNPPTSPVVWIGGAALAVAGAGAVAVPALRKRRTALEALTAARQRMDEARQAAGVAIADLGRRVHVAQEKAQYDTISYAPAEVAHISADQRRGEQLFGAAQATFDAAEEGRTALEKPAAADYDRLAEQYVEAERLAQEAAEPIERAEQVRARLDRAASSSRGAASRLDSADV